MGVLRRFVLRLMNAVHHDHRDARSFIWLDEVLWDVRYALRRYRRSPSFTAAAVGMLALGIGPPTTPSAPLRHCC